jgi:hypothetical protein
MTEDLPMADRTLDKQRASVPELHPLLHPSADASVCDRTVCFQQE